MGVLGPYGYLMELIMVVALGMPLDEQCIRLAVRGGRADLL